MLQGVAIALLGLLVVGLLRSHAEILRRLHDLGVGLGDPSGDGDSGASDPLPRPRPAPLPGAAPTAGPAAAPAHDVVGETPLGETAAVGIAGASHDTLLAFLSSGCLTCADFWRAFSDADRLGLPPHVRPLIVTKSPDAESVSEIEKLAPRQVTVVMSTPAWVDYDVPGSPYFVLVDGPAAEVVGEGTGDSWDQVRSLLVDAGSLAAGPGISRSRRRVAPDRAQNHQDRRDLVDGELLAAGIGPGHPSLDPEEQDEAGG